MVGVPGRSKGCSTCRRRKKKCDLAQPACGNCVKGKLACGGYKRELIVVEFDNQKSQYRPQSLDDQSSVTPHEPSLADVRSKDLNRSAYEIECFDSFWGIYLPKGVSIRSPIHPSRESNVVERWAQWTQGMVPNSYALRCALLALSMSKVGRSRQDQDMVYIGIELYGRSLSRIVNLLKAPSHVDQLQMIATCRILAIYEQLNDTTSSARNWLRHVNGLTQLVQLQGPECYAKPCYHEMFFEARYNELVSALAARKATFLSSPEWITKPWEGLHKSTADTITDILVMLPKVLEEFDVIVAMRASHEITERARNLSEMCLGLDAQLRRWHESFASHFLELFNSEETPRLHDGINGLSQNSLSIIFMRYGLTPLYSMALYWSACVILYDTMLALFTLYPQNNPLEFEPPSQPRLDPRNYCLYITRVVGYFLDKEVGLVSAMSIAFPVGCVAQYMYRQELAGADKATRSNLHEFERMLEVIEETAEGTWVGSFLADMKNTPVLTKVRPNEFYDRVEKGLTESQPVIANAEPPGPHQFQLGPVYHSLNDSNLEEPRDVLSWRSFPFLYLDIVKHQEHQKHKLLSLHAKPI